MLQPHRCWTLKSSHQPGSVLCTQAAHLTPTFRRWNHEDFRVRCTLESEMLGKKLIPNLEVHCYQDVLLRAFSAQRNGRVCLPLRPLFLTMLPIQAQLSLRGLPAAPIPSPGPRWGGSPASLPARTSALLAATPKAVWAFPKARAQRARGEVERHKRLRSWDGEAAAPHCRGLAAVGGCRALTLGPPSPVTFSTGDAGPCWPRERSQGGCRLGRAERPGSGTRPGKGLSSQGSSSPRPLRGGG